MSAFSNIIAGARAGIANPIGVSIQQFSQGNVANAVTNLVNSGGDLVNTYAATAGIPLGDGFSGINARADAVQTWCWYCIPPIVGNNSSVNFGDVSGIPGGVQGSVTLPWYYVQSANLPLRSINTEPINRNGHPIYYPESYSVDGLTLGLFMDSTSISSQWLAAWDGLVLGNDTMKNPNNQGAWGLPAVFKKDINFVVLSVDKKQLLNIRYIGCYPRSADALSLVSDSSTPMVLNVSFSVDDIDVLVSNDKGFFDNLKDTVKGYAIGALSGAATNLVS